MWDILAAVFLVGMVFLVPKVLKRDRLYKTLGDEEGAVAMFLPDKKVGVKHIAGKVHRVYKNTHKYSDIIDKYVLGNEGNVPYVICNFAKPLPEKHGIEVYGYDVNKRLVNRVDVDDTAQFQDNPILRLPRTVTYVNVRLTNEPETPNEPVTNETDDAGESVEAKTTDTKKPAFKQFAMQQTIWLLAMLVPLSYVLLYAMVTLFTEDTVNQYMNFSTVGLGLLLMAIASAGNYIWTMLWLNRQYNRGETHG